MTNNPFGDAWQLEEGKFEEVPARGKASKDPVAINRADPMSPLTLRAINVMAAAVTVPADGAATVLVKVGSIALQMED